MPKIDLHCHTRFSPDSFTRPEELVTRCVATKLDHIAITDHNTIDGAVEVKRLAPFEVIIGEEIKSSGGEIIGLFLEKAIPAGLTPLDTVKQIKQQGGLVSIPHPFDNFRQSVITKDALEEILPYTDIIEAFNSRNTLQRANRKALQLASNHDIAISSVSDSHTLTEIGRSYVEIPEFDCNPSGLIHALRQGLLIRKQITPLIHILTTLTKAQKRATRFWNRWSGQSKC